MYPIMTTHPRRMVPLVLWVCLLAAVTGPALGQAPALANPEAAARAEAVVADMAAGRFDDVYGRFDQKMRAALPAAKLAAGWNAVRQASGAFDAIVSTSTRSQDGYQIAVVTCAFERTNVDVQVVFNGAGEIAGLAMRPGEARAVAGIPAYAEPTRYAETEVTVGSGQWALPGTLTVPAGDGPFPVVVLVHGSGPQDRDETVGAAKPFRDLALGLASRGVAVLRYDKRSRVHGRQMIGQADMTVDDEVVDDARAAIALVKQMPRLEADRVFVVGHSLGGMLGPRIVAGQSVAGLIIMAGPTRPLQELLVEQTRHVLSADGSLSDDDRAQVEQVELLAERIRSLGDSDAGLAEPLAGAPAAYWIDLRSYDPADAAANLDVPMLILQGERDYQVTMADFEGWRSALSGRSNVTLKSYPSLNHLFIAGTGRSLPNEYLTPGNVDVQVIDDIAAWIEQLQ
jgi:fermentation-respiration switch protein FrsA (DUF1100 family)